jgi:hypothetical protein
VQKPTVEAHVPFTVVVKDFACPHLQVKFVPARMDIGQVHKVDVVSMCLSCMLVYILYFLSCILLNEQCQWICNGKNCRIQTGIFVTSLLWFMICFLHNTDEV